MHTQTYPMRETSEGHRSYVSGYLKYAVKEFFSIEQVEYVLLYGSYVRGNFTRQSDVDVGVFICDGADLIAISKSIWKLCGKYKIDIQPQIFYVSELIEPMGIVEEITEYGVDAYRYFFT